MSTYTQEVERVGLGRSHELAVHLVPPGATVLDVGCASGYLARALLAHGADAVDGLELAGADAEAARSVCRTVVTGSVEDAAVTALVPDAVYDAVVLADVLEHLRDPAAVLGRLVPKLRPGGRVVLSVPNVAHWSVRMSLLRGRFRYTDVGLLDRTHLRFFTQETLHALVEEAGLRVVAESIAFRGLTDPDAVARAPLLGSAVARPYARAAHRLAGLLGYQFVLAAVPTHPAGAHRGFDYPSAP